MADQEEKQPDEMEEFLETTSYQADGKEFDEAAEAEEEEGE